MSPVSETSGRSENMNSRMFFRLYLRSEMSINSTKRIITSAMHLSTPLQISTSEHGVRHPTALSNQILHQ